MPVAAEKQAFGAKEQDTVPSPAAVTEPDDPNEQSGDVFEAEDDIQSPLVYKPQGCAHLPCKPVPNVIFCLCSIGRCSWEELAGRPHEVNLCTIIEPPAVVF